VLLAACEAQAAHAQCADFAGELMRESMLAEGSQEAKDDESQASSARGAPKQKSAVGRVLAKMSGKPRGKKPEEKEDEPDDPESDPAIVAERLQRLEHENSELLRKTSVLVDYVRATAPVPRGAYDAGLTPGQVAGGAFPGRASAFVSSGLGGPSRRCGVTGTPRRAPRDSSAPTRAAG